MTDSRRTFNWKLDKKMYNTSIFIKKKMREYSPIGKVLGFIKEKMGNEKLKKYSSYNLEIDMIKAYKNIYKDKIFHTSFILSKHKWGRINPTNFLSLSIMHRPTRHSLCDDIYVDIDMVNASSTIIYQIAKINNIDCPILKKYVDEPALYREKIMKLYKCSKDVAKVLMISILGGGSFDAWIKRNNLNKSIVNPLDGLENEMKPLIEIVYINNQSIKKDVQKINPTQWVDINEEKRGIMSLWYQSIEKLFQETAIQSILSNEIKLEDIVPCQDGFMILKSFYNNNILKVCEESIFNSFGISVKFINKPFDEKIEIPIAEEGQTMDEWTDNLSVKVLSCRLLELKNNYILRTKNELFIYYNNRWFDETDINKRYKLTKYISEDLYDCVKKEIENDISLKNEDKNILFKLLRNNTSKSSSMNDIMKHTLCNAKESIENFDSKSFLLGFNNGVWDFIEGKFRDYKFDDYMTLSVGYDYRELTEDEESKKYKFKELFDSIQPNPEQRDYLLQILSSGLDGKAYQKMHFFNGLGGNGKGLIGSLMKCILGEYYHQPSNGVLKDSEKANVPSPDLYNLKNKRYINFKELEGNIKVSSLRNLTGDGDFCGRLLNKNPETFQMVGTFVAEFNNPPDLDGRPLPADYRRMVNISFPVNFTDDDDKLGVSNNGIEYKKGNNTYTTVEFREEYKYIFLNCLLDVYNTYQDKIKTNGIKFEVPSCIKEGTNKLMDSLNLFNKFTNDLWVLGSSTKKTGVKEIWESVKNHNEYKVLGSQLKKQYSRDEFHKWLSMKYKIEQTAQYTKYIIGLESIEYEEEELN